MRIGKVISLVAFSLIVLNAAASAHHSFAAEYDADKLTTITGFVTKLDWVNPHAFVFIQFKDEHGKMRNFTIEMGPPYALARGGWKRDTLKIGDKVTIEGAALAKDGSDAVGSMQTTSIILANGQKLIAR